MSSSKEADLTTAVLLYAMRCLAEGDQQALRAMNFGPKELEALKGMNLSDLYRADALRVRCLKIGLDRAVFWPMLEHLQRQRESEDLQRAMIVADAPLEMMQQLFGLSSREYTRWRRLLTLAPSVGRPSDQSLIYPPRLSDNQKILADRYLALVAPEERQLLLDELQGRLESEQKGMKPVYDELRFLHSLCKAAQQGEFVPNLGIKVVEARQSRKQAAEPAQSDAQKEKTAEERERSRAYGLDQLAKLRESLGFEDKS